MSAGASHQTAARVRTSWTPGDIPDIIAWYRGESHDGATTLLDLGSTANGRTKNNLTMVGTAVNNPIRYPRKFNRTFAANRRPTVQFIDVDLHAANAANAAAFSALHKQAGGSLWLRAQVFDATTTVLINNYGSTTTNGPGIWVQWVGTQGSEHLEVYVSRGSAFGVVYVGANASVVLGRAFDLEVRLSQANGYEVRLDGVIVASGSITGTLSNTDAPYPLAIGAYANGVGGSSTMRLHDCGFVGRYITDAERSAAYAWREARYKRVGAAYYTTSPVRIPLTGTVKTMFMGDSLLEGETGPTTLLGGTRRAVYNASLGWPEFTMTQIGPRSFSRFAGDAHDALGGTTIRGNMPTGTNPTTFVTKGHHPDSIPADVITVNNAIAPTGPYHPDVVYIELGINNIQGVSNTARYNNDNVSDLIEVAEFIRKNEPSARFIFANLQRSFASGDTRAVDAFNAELVTALDWFENGGATVVVRKNTRGIIDLAAQTSDNLHRNDAGAQRDSDGANGFAGAAQCIRYAAGYT